MNPFRTAFRNPVLIFLLPAVLIASCSSISTPPPSGEPAQTISRLDSVFIDGEAGDWQASACSFRIFSDLSGNVPDTSDLSVRLSLAWDSTGLLVLVEVTDDSIYEDPSNFWNGDGMELFISPVKGSPDIIQYSVRPSFDLGDTAAAVNYYDYRASGLLLRVAPSARFHSVRTLTGYRMEGAVPLGPVGLPRPEAGSEIALQLYINDFDRKGDSTNFSLPWYPVRESYNNPYAFFRIRLEESGNPGTSPEVRAYIIDDKLLYVKIISDNILEGKRYRLFADHAVRKFNLLPGKQGLFSKTMEFPYKPTGQLSQSLRLYRKDQLLFSVDPYVLHRVSENTPPPHPYEEEIRIFEIRDHFNPPPLDATLFTGSSSIRKWTDIERYFPEVTLLSRGFGGSTMKDLNYYAGRIVFPYHPARVFVYEGDNDIAGGATPEEFIQDCRDFIEACRKNIPQAEIIFLSIKPSLARIRYWKKMHAANGMLEELAAANDQVRFIDISSGMLDPEGRPRKDIFVEDGLHLNAKGYRILSDALKPVVYE